MTPEKASRLAANLLIQAFKLVCPEDEAGDIDYLQGASFPRAGSGRKYFVPGDADNVISRAVTKIRNAVGTYPTKALPMMLTQIVLDTKESGTPTESAHQELQRQVLALLSELESLGTWVVLYAVRGVQTESEPFSIGHSTFLRMDDQEFLRWGQRFSTGTYDPPEEAPVHSTWKHDEGVLLGQAVAVTKVRAADRTHAESEGCRVIEESLNVLRYGQLMIDWPHGPFPELGLSAMWSTQNVQHHSVCLRIDAPDAGSSKSIAAAEGALLNYCRSAPAWELIQPLLLVEPPLRSEMQNRMLTALSWVGQAALASSESIRVVSLTTALETLLIREHESVGKRSKLMDRVPQFPKLPDSRHHIDEADIDTLYKIRSACLHAGITEVDKSDRKLACLAVAQSLHGILDNETLSSTSTLEEILATLCQADATDDQVLSLESTREPPGYYVGESRVENGSKLSVPLRFGNAINGVFKWSGLVSEMPTVLLQLQGDIEAGLQIQAGTIVRLEDE